MTHIVWLMLTIFMISSKYHCDALIKESDKKNGTEMVDNSSTETSPYKLKGTEEYALEKLTFLGNDNSSINETEILENWFQFKHRFALQCTLVFLLLLCVMFLCFFPDEPMFDISYNKYDTNEITKYTKTTIAKTKIVVPANKEKTTASSSISKATLVKSAKISTGSKL